MAAIFGKSIPMAARAKGVFLAAAAVYFFCNASDRYGYHFLDNVDLAIHEAGHVFFAFCGEFVAVAGGTIMQLSVPLIFAGYFFLKNDRYSAGVVLLWLGQNSINVARYAGDAQKMDLELLGGGHDWNYLLSATGLILKAGLVSDVFYYAGVAIITGGVIIGILSFSKYGAKSNEYN